LLPCHAGAQVRARAINVIALLLAAALTDACSRSSAGTSGWAVASLQAKMPANS
jgi:hypothetical protein